MKKENPTLTIITVCFNIKDEIERTCKSIVNQTWQDFEWIVVDGGSTDGTVDILKQYAGRINVLISEPDKGIYNAMNKGIKLAHGEWLNFMNGGDKFAADNVLEKVFKNKEYDADVLYGNCIEITQDNKEITKKMPDIIDYKWFKNSCINHQNSFIKKILFNENGLYNENYKITADREKWYLWSFLNKKFFHIDFAFAKFYLGGLSFNSKALYIKELQCLKNIYYPKVSVIIPVYNAGKYLNKCLNSVIEQTLKDIEIICINDGSIDNSLEILTKFAKKDFRIKIINQTNTGSAAARNNGLTIARGEYIGFIDSDDYISNDFFENLYKTAINKKADIAATDNVLIYENHKYKTKFVGIEPQQSFITNRDLKSKIILTTGTSCNKIYKNEFLKKYNIKFYPIKSVAEDNYFTDLAIIYSNSIAINHKSIYYYRMHNSSLVHQKKTDWNFFDIYRQIKHRINDSNLDYNDKYYWQNIINARQCLDAKSHLINCTKNDINKFIKCIKKETYSIIVSLTSFPARINTVNQTIESLLKQTIKPDKIILWLANEQFPNKEKDLPQNLLKLQNNGLSIMWCNDLKSFKKLIPALKKYPNDIIITADDDILYPENWLERLLNGYLKHPNMINCHRAHRIHFNNNKILPYKQWHGTISKTEPGFINFLTGAGGVLYPPHCLNNNVLNIDKFQKLSPQADDIWFWAMAVLNKTKINVVENNITTLHYIEGTQEADTCLWKTNTGTQNLNDTQLQNVLREYPEILENLKEEMQEQNKKGIDIKQKIILYKLFNFIPLLSIENT